MKLLRLLVSPWAPPGQPDRAIDLGNGRGPALYFRTQADLDVYLDKLEELGVQCDTSGGLTNTELADARDPECVARWPGCRDGEYDPKCCRFPKSCSCGG
jgi:hypothetical protein